jgi:hypothetical protein
LEDFVEGRGPVKREGCVSGATDVEMGECGIVSLSMDVFGLYYDSIAVENEGLEGCSRSSSYSELSTRGRGRMGQGGFVGDDKSTLVSGGGERGSSAGAAQMR